MCAYFYILYILSFLKKIIVYRDLYRITLYSYNRKN